MKKEIYALLVSAISNALISGLKIITGIFGNCITLISDGINTACEVIVDIFSIVGLNYSHKRANMLHPYGYGRAEYITNLFISTLIFAVSIYIMIDSFSADRTAPSLNLGFVVIAVILIKISTIIYLNRVGKKLDSHMLLTASKISQTDLISTVFVLIIILVSQLENTYPFLSYLDNIGSFIIGLDIMHLAIKLASDNSLALIGERCYDKQLINDIKEELSTIKKTTIEDITLFKYGEYFRSTIRISVSPNMKISDFIGIEKEIKERLKNKKYNVKYTTVEISGKPKR